MNRNELTHYGILGMKWGKRRFQNKDGTLTPAGKSRYDDDGPSGSNGIVSQKKPSKYKSPYDMSTDHTKTQKPTTKIGKTLEKMNDQLDSLKKTGPNDPSVKKKKVVDGEKIFNKLKDAANNALDKAETKNFFESEDIFSEKSMKTKSLINRTRDALNNVDYKTLTSPSGGKKLIDTGKKFLNDYLEDADDRSFFNDDWDTMQEKRDRNEALRNLIKK